jgi:stress response protein YsnF
MNGWRSKSTIGRPVDAMPPVRQEGDTTIMSVVEETIVVERHLFLKEEVQIRRLRVSERH